MRAELLLREFARIADAPDALGRLRRFVLDLAVRGKITDRNPTDEPASQLLLRIERRMIESSQLGVKRKVVSSLQLDPKEIPFPVPTGWLWTRIRKVTRDRGQTVPSTRFTYIDVTAIDKEAGRIGETAVLEPSNAPSRARKIVRFGDVLYSCVRPYLLNIAVVDMAIEPPPIASTAFAVLDGLGLVEPRYLWTVLRSPYFVGCVEKKMRGQAYPAINDSDFALLPVPLAPFAEQGRIVAKVDELMALCDQLEATQKDREIRRDGLRGACLNRLTANDSDGATSIADVRFFLDSSPRLITKPDHVAAVRQTILDLAVRGRLVPQGPADEPAAQLLAWISEAKASRVKHHGAIGRVGSRVPQVPAEGPFKLPHNWLWTQWQAVALRIGDIDHKMPDSVTSGGFPYVSPRDFQPGNRIDFVGAKRISDMDFHRLAAKIRPEVGDLIYPRYGTIGETRMVDDGREFLASYSCAVIKVMKPFIDPRFQFIFSMSDVARHQARAAINMATQPNVGIKSIKDFLFPLPPAAEQQRIVAKVGELMAVCDELEAALATARTGRGRLLESLIHQALAAGTSDAPKLTGVATG